MTRIAGDNSQLKTIVERIEHVEVEIKDLQNARNDIYAEAKGHGYNVKAMKTAVSRRKADATKLAEHEAEVELYMEALKSLVRP
ncbi:DUF2312 domain-containing protein [Tardiphaga sp. 538_B7_N1_4]|uniref:DUF2312 domain-containing protein n=1 Tax=Tardiphaga sp. 538_B7_N1_4 TaxID=3240778 RepID=UPI003F27AE0F